jgi:hypothetical protein
MKLRGIVFVVIGALAGIPAGPSVATARALPLHGPRYTTGTVWGGYATETSLTTPQDGAFTDVKGTWTVPYLTCGSSNALSSTWIGLDGYADSMVEQIGTEQDCMGGSAQYSAWYEMYPKQTKVVSLAIHPGDTMTSEVQYVGNSNFQLTLTDQNDGVNGSFTTVQKLQKAKLESAEWVVEPPTTGHVSALANFGSETFSGCSVTVNGHPGTISSGEYDPMTLVSTSGATIGTPSTLRGGGTSFTFNYVGS